MTAKHYCWPMSLGQQSILGTNVFVVIECIGVLDFIQRIVLTVRMAQRKGSTRSTRNQGVNEMRKTKAADRPILVTGGCGFIGANFIMAWLDANLGPVINVDSLTYAGHTTTLKDYAENPRYHFVQGELCDRALIERLLKQYQPSSVVHFAAETHVDRSIQDPDIFMQINIQGSFALLEASRAYWRECNPQEQAAFRFLHVSTDEVYGTLGVEDPAFTEAHPYRPNNPYAASKAASDHLARAWFHTYGLPVITTHSSNNHGPYQLPEKLIPRVITHALAAQPLPLYGEGHAVRDWLYVADHCAALRQILTQGEPGVVYNIGGGNERSVIEVVTLICEYLDQIHPWYVTQTERDPIQHSHRQLIEFIANRPGHDRRYAINASKVKRELGWRPLESFEAGLKKTIQWYIDHSEWVEKVSSEVAKRPSDHLGRRS